MRILTFSGVAESGKDLSAQILKEALEDQEKKVLIFHYADLLKFYAKQYFGWDGNKDEKGRTLLQYIGTDIVRKKDENFWVKSAIEFFKIFSSEYDYILVSDCRFPNEIEYLKKNNFDVLSIHLNRPNHQNRLTPEQKLHPSEIALNNYKFDIYLTIEEGISNLIDKVHSLVEDLDL